MPAFLIPLKRPFGSGGGRSIGIAPGIGGGGAGGTIPAIIIGGGGGGATGTEIFINGRKGGATGTCCCCCCCCCVNVGVVVVLLVCDSLSIFISRSLTCSSNSAILRSSNCIREILSFDAFDDDTRDGRDSGDASI